jgi:hypothetical protein
MAAKNSPYFGAFPKIEYDINNISTYIYGPHETVTDIFFRFGILRSIVDDVTSYYTYEVQDSDTPELLAEQVYGDSGAAWIILYANGMVDPLFDWPLNYDAFQKMIIGKYGSVENAKTTTHHAEKIITRYNTFYQTSTVTRFNIDENRLTIFPWTQAPYEYYNPYTQYVEATADDNYYSVDTDRLTADSYTNARFNFVDTPIAANTYTTYSVDGKTIHETVSGLVVSNYDYEERLNEERRLIKVIKSEYYSQIMKEFRSITGTNPAYVRA